VFQQHFSLLSFFCFEIMCQYVIGEQKTLGFFHDLIEMALNYKNNVSGAFSN